jgi:hypothetical protein
MVFYKSLEGLCDFETSRPVLGGGQIIIKGEEWYPLLFFV